MLWIFSNDAAVSIKEDNLETLKQKRINDTKEKIYNIIRPEYHNNIQWHINKWQNSISQWDVRVCEIEARIDI